MIYLLELWRVTKYIIVSSMKDILFDVRVKLQEVLFDLRGLIYFDYLKKDPQKYFPKHLRLPESLDLRIEKNQTGFSVYSDDYLGLMTFAGSKDELEDTVNDAVFTYFSVPRDIARRIPNIYTFKEFAGSKSKFKLAIA